MKFFGKSKFQKHCNQCCLSKKKRKKQIKGVWGGGTLFKRTLGLVHTGQSGDNLLEWQAIKLTFFAPCSYGRLSALGKHFQLLIKFNEHSLYNTLKALRYRLKLT